MGIFLKSAGFILMGLITIHGVGIKGQKDFWPTSMDGTKIWKRSQELILVMVHSGIFSESSNAMVYGHSIAIIKAFNFL